MNALTQPVPQPIPVKAVDRTVGAVVIGGDYQGLGIVRSLGRQGVPVCVVDDELSISRYSRYCTKFVKLANLHDERVAVDSLLDLGRRLGLDGWVLYPTREELVAALSRYRSELSEVFRVPTPDWESVKWAWDKRNTYRLAQRLEIPTPATHYPENLDQLAELDSATPPFAIKPAIKEHFFYATKAKAWRANSHAELRTLFQKASDLAGDGEIMVQELIPGGGRSNSLIARFSATGKRWARWLCGARGNTLLSSAEPAPMSRPWTFRFSRSSPSDSCARSITTVWWKWSTNSIRGIPNTSCST